MILHRLILFYILAIFSCQTWSFASVIPLSYNYDASGNFYIDRNIEPELQKLNYDDGLNFPEHTESADVKTNIGALLAFIDSFLVPKEGGDLFRVVDDVELSDIQKTGSFRNPPGTFDEGKQFVDNLDDAEKLQKKFSDFFGVELFKELTAYSDFEQALDLIRAGSIISGTALAGYAICEVTKVCKIGRVLEGLKDIGKGVGGLARKGWGKLKGLFSKKDVPKGGDDLIFRQGTFKETPSRLDRKSKEALENKNIGIHGVSGSTKKLPGDCSTATCSALGDAGFKVHKTPTDANPNHVTIELPNPVTKPDADKFNQVFGR